MITRYVPRHYNNLMGERCAFGDLQFSRMANDIPAATTN